MNRKNVLIILALIGTAMSITVQPAYAHDKDWEGNHSRGQGVFGAHRHYSQRPQSYGYIALELPRGFISITVGGDVYHYHDGLYYHKTHYGYVVTPPPFGACIHRLPRGYTKIYIDGQPYYTYNGDYYDHTPDGYVVVEKPEPRHAKQGRTAKEAEVKYDATFEINIPNEHGGYTTVILKRSGEGFTGPQGEYYEEFSRVDKLKVIYGS